MKIKVRSNAFKCLKDLGEGVMFEIDKKLLAGQSGLEVATWLQTEAELLVDMKPMSLKKTLERYRHSELRRRTMERIALAQSSTPAKIIIKRVNALDELEEAVKQQRARVDKLLMRESQLPGGILLKDTTNEMRLLKDMLLNLGTLQMETGYMPRASKTFKGTMTDANGETKSFEWTEEQEELFNELQQADAHAAEDA